MMLHPCSVLNIHLFNVTLKPQSNPSAPDIRSFVLTGLIVPHLLRLSVSPSVLLPPPLPVPPCLLVNELLLLKAMGKENRLAPGRLLAEAARVSKTLARVAPTANLSQPSSNKRPHLVIRSLLVSEGQCGQDPQPHLRSFVYALSC